MAISEKTGSQHPGDVLSYEAPAIKVMELSAEGSFCASELWYKEGGEGDFSFTVEENETWG